MSVARALVGKAVRMGEVISLANEIGYPVGITVIEGAIERRLDHVADEALLKQFVASVPGTALAYVRRAAG